MSWYFFNSIDGACSSADYIVNFFFNYSLDIRAHYLWHFKPVIGNSAVCCSLSSHIFVSPPTSHRPCWYQFLQLGEQRTQLLCVSSLSKAISQKPSRRASNPRPSDPESETLTARPRTHQISPDLTRKQAEEDRKLRVKLKEIRIKGEVLDGVKICKGRIVGRVDGHVIYDPSAWLVGGLPKKCI